MRKVMAGVVAVATALALAGCASRTTYDSEKGLFMPEDTVSLGDALGLTGALLLIPLGVFIALWITWGFDRWRSPRTEEEKDRARVVVIIASAILVVILVLWLSAIWAGFGGN